MTIRRSERRSSAAIPTALLNDKSLSWKARGLAAFILSKPDEWRIDSVSLSRIGPDGRDSIRAGLNELREQGYLVSDRRQNEQGQWVTESVLHEDPQAAPAPENPASANPPPAPEKPTSGKPTAGFPGAMPLVGEVLKPERKSTRTQRALSSVPQPFDVTPGMREWAADKTPSIDIAAETEQFVDYHLSRGSRHRDWEATWRTWMRNAVKYSRIPRENRPPPISQRVSTNTTPGRIQL